MYRISDSYLNNKLEEYSHVVPVECDVQVGNSWFGFGTLIWIFYLSHDDKSKDYRPP